MSKFDGLVKGHKKTEIVKVQTDESAKPKMGRPKGKRSDPNFKQLTVLIREDTRVAAQRLLFGTGKDLSELLEDLLAAWVKQHG